MQHLRGDYIPNYFWKASHMVSLVIDWANVNSVKSRSVKEREANLSK